MRRIALGALLVGAVAAVVGAFALTGDDGPSAAEVTRYEDALRPIVTEWGRIEVQGMRPAIGDLQSGEGVPAETVVGEAAAWRASFEALQARLRGLRPPAELRDAAALFDRSMARYIEAAVAFGTAAAAPAGPEREAGVGRGISLARDGARIYNEASMALQATRRQAGLEPSPDFPDHPAGQG